MSIQGKLTSGEPTLPWLLQTHPAADKREGRTLRNRGTPGSISARVLVIQTCTRARAADEGTSLTAAPTAVQQLLRHECVQPVILAVDSSHLRSELLSLCVHPRELHQVYSDTDRHSVVRLATRILQSAGSDCWCPGAAPPRKSQLSGPSASGLEEPTASTLTCASKHGVQCVSAGELSAGELYAPQKAALALPGL
jgi:hypothetical protein